MADGGNYSRASSGDRTGERIGAAVGFSHDAER
jgi:hypothetical protein